LKIAIFDDLNVRSALPDCAHWGGKGLRGLNRPIGLPPVQILGATAINYQIKPRIEPFRKIAALNTEQSF